ncbi:MAG TPA: DMT family transporter [Ramlibacter sp.]|uniref:DMT family transporter n=1 Tax=Ramlibacter sp. TaxID=1917967 RepID=UPI002CCA8EC0|nr:DMT family transporter [Ramlibacter sp.]HVZ43333.1 DMT family transporter [Ramlibacter sp.]
MPPRLNLATAALLTVTPLLWAGNAVTGRIVSPLISPMLLNFLRWGIAFVLLVPISGGLLRPGSILWPRWRRFALLGLLGIGSYNALQYLALRTSTALNATLVAASMPVFMMTTGALFFGQRVTSRHFAGAALSIAGVLVVLSHGDIASLAQVRFVPGDLLMLAATAAWSWYSWLLAAPGDPPELRGNWAAFLMSQLVFGVAWSGLFATGEWALASSHAEWGGALALALAYVAIGPAIVAYRCWGIGVQRVGPSVAAFFGNLTPLFAAVLSAAFLGEMPGAHHALAFALIVAGIVVSSSR